MSVDRSDATHSGPVIILQHEVEGLPGTVGRVLQAEGIRYVVRRVRAGEPVPTSAELLSSSGLVLLGGGMNTDDDDKYPWLADEHRILHEAVERDVPVLGICLGAQQLAAATGGRVYHRESPERGWMPIDVTDDDELFAGLPRRFSTLQSHADSFEAPSEAVLFARRNGDQQAFRVGRRAWGVQFHPEVDDELIEEWFAYARRENPGFEQYLRRMRVEIVTGSVPLCTTIVRNFVRCF